MQRAGASVDTYAMARVAVRTEFSLKGLDLRSQHELTVFEHRIDRLGDLIANGRVLRLEVNEWNHRVYSVHVRPAGRALCEDNVS